MYFSHVKLGQEVIVTSDCSVYGMIGTVVKLDSPSVYVEFETMPPYYLGNNPVRLVSNSLKPKKEFKEKFEKESDDVRIGVFYCSSYTVIDDFISANHFSTNGDECLIVRAKSKEACMKILADLIAEGDVDDEEYDMFVFDDQQYKIKTQVSVVIDDE